MLKNYLKIAFRNLTRKRVFSLVNILGLSVGIASVMIISTYLISELSFDQFHSKADSIYRVLERIKAEDQDERLVSQLPGAIAVAGKTEIAGIEESVRVMQLGGINLKYEDKEFEDDFVAVDENFFSFFDFKLLSGTAENVFKQPLSVVMSETQARKFFGNENPIGKTIDTHINSRDFVLTVTGIMEDMPENSHLNFEMLFALSTPDTFFDEFSSFFDTNWTFRAISTYVRLGAEVSDELVAQGLTDLVLRNRPDDFAEKGTFSLQALGDIHFGSIEVQNELNEREGDLTYVYIFFFIGLLILAVAFTNYINLSTIKATDRIKEIGLRRVVGANGRQLMTQFMSESVLICMISLVLAVTLLQFSSPLVTLLFGTDLLHFIYFPEYMLGLTGSVLALGLCAGLYPALTVLKGNTVMALKNQTLAGRKQTFFKGVVLFQFITSLVMIVATLVVYNQLNYITNKDLGYTAEALGVIDISSNDARVNQEMILNGFKNDPDVLAASITSRVPGEWKSYYEVSLEDDEKNEYTGIPFMGVDENFLEVFEIDLLAGNNFRGDSGDTLKLLVNETLARQLGIENAVGQTVGLSGIQEGVQVLGLTATIRFQIIGVIRDFHFQSLREEIPPMAFAYKQNVLQNIDYFIVKLRSQNMSQTMDRLKGVMKEFDQSPFGYNFLDDKLERYYVEDARRSKLFFIASSIAVLIAFIGLFALVHFALQKRLKEMSVRKVLGASISSLIMLLSKDYLKLLLIALAIAAPLSYWGMSGWLNEFVYRTSVSWWVFGLALLVCLLITAITALTQISKTARRNPAEILRQE